MSKTPTQNDWKKEFQGWAFDHDRRYFKSAEGKRLMSLISKFLTDARKEVIDVVDLHIRSFRTCDADKKYIIERLEHVLATFRKETK